MSFDLASIRIGVVGLGYVGLPLAVEFGANIQPLASMSRQSRIDELVGGTDSTLEVPDSELAAAERPNVQCFSRRSCGLQFLHRHGADSDRRWQPPAVLTPLRNASMT